MEVKEKVALQNEDFDTLAPWKNLYQERCHFVLENAPKAPLRVKSKAPQGLACKEMDELFCKIMEREGSKIGEKEKGKGLE